MQCYGINQTETDMYKGFLNKYVVVTTKSGNNVLGTLKSYSVPNFLILETSGAEILLNNEPVHILHNFQFVLDEKEVAAITIVNATPLKCKKVLENRGCLPPLINKNPSFNAVANQGYKLIYEED